MTTPGPRDNRHADDAGRDDPLAALVDAFASLPTPDATPDLDDTDASTRAAVDWTKRAFDALPVPAPDVGVLRDGRRRPASPRVDERSTPVHPLQPLARLVPLRWARAAAAAVVFATLAWLLSTDDASTVDVPLVADGAGATSTDARTPADDAPRDATRTPTDARLAHDTGREDAPPPARRVIPGFREAPTDALVAAATTDHLEVSSGPVRLVLVTNRPGLQPGLPPDLP